MENKDNRFEEQIKLAINDFGGFVAENRKDCGMTLEELAERTNLSASFVFRVERNYRGTSLNTRLNFLLNGFNWDLDEVMLFLQETIKDKESLKRISN